MRITTSDKNTAKPILKRAKYTQFAILMWERCQKNMTEIQPRLNIFFSFVATTF